MTSTTVDAAVLLQEALAPGAIPRIWSGAPLLKGAVEELQSQFDGITPSTISEPRLEQVVRALSVGSPLSLAQLEACCAAVAFPIELDGHRVAIIDLRNLTERLIEQLRAPRPGGMTRIAAGLARGLLAAPAGEHRTARNNLAALASQLYELLDAKPDQIRPTVAEVLRRLEPALLHQDVSGFVSAVFSEDDGALADLHRLFVPPESWFWAALADEAATVAERRSPSEYRRMAPVLAEWLRQRPHLLESGLARILRHLAEGHDRSEVPLVGEMAVERWGSPHQETNIARWRAKASEPARQLVAGWIARQVIELFFDTLTAHGDPQRRATYWSSKAEQVDELWVFAGRALAGSQHDDAQTLRRLLGSRFRRLTDEDDTSMFVMRIGNYFFAEFSTSGNALYVYHRRDLPATLGQDLGRAGSFKDPVRGRRVPHVGQWQTRVSEFIARIED